MKRGMVLISPYYHPVAKQQAILTDTVRCETWCGGGERICGKVQHDKAAKLAQKAWRMLGNPEFKVALNHNLGWHPSLVSLCGRMKVSVHEYNGKMSFTAYLGEAGDAGGLFAEHGKTPRAAVRNVVRVAKEHLRRYGALIDGLPVV